jgi:hypothetical protein
MKEIKAKEGFYLTQASEVSTEERMFLTAIKGANVNEADWREATIEEKEAWEKPLEESEIV